MWLVPLQAALHGVLPVHKGHFEGPAAECPALIEASPDGHH